MEINSNNRNGDFNIQKVKNITIYFPLITIMIP